MFLGGRGRDIKAKKHILVYQKAVRSAIVHESESWKLTGNKKTKNKIIVTGMRFLRIIKRITKRDNKK